MDIKKTLKVKSYGELVKDFIGIFIGTSLYAIGYVCFQLPYTITPGGTAGIGALAYYAANIPPEWVYLLINVMLLVPAFKKLGTRFIVYTIIAMLCMTFAIGEVQELVRLADGTLPKIVHDKFLSCVIGASLDGIGVAMVFLNNGSCGGTDIIAAVVNRKRDVSLGQIVLLSNLIIITCSLFIKVDLETLLYSYMSLIVQGYMIDYTMAVVRQSLQFFIFSKKYDEIAEEISRMGRGITVLNGTGWYSKKEVKVLVVMARRRDSNNIFKIIKDIDPNAFVSQTKVQGVWGKGFDVMKGE
ncbi:MAG: YitT family protein [Prevotellaceae bacterium]|nr:YitT family protein [Candidatus Faecinaster equi]